MASPVTTFEILDPGTPVLAAPDDASKRIGVVARGSVLHGNGWVDGRGLCPRYASLAPEGFVCAKHAARSGARPYADTFPSVSHGKLLPRNYAFVRHDGAPIYASRGDIVDGVSSGSLGEGFGVVVKERRDVVGRGFVRLRGGYWIEAASLRPAGGSLFAGKWVARNNIGLAWARKDFKHQGIRYLKRHAFQIATQNEESVITPEGLVLSRSNVHVALVGSRPKSLTAADASLAWVDVNIAEQTLLVVRGEQPIFGTLISSGKKRRTHDTPKGEHRVWAKLAYSDMNNLERDDLERNYAIEDVPWVQYFKKGNGFHAAFWHDAFGRRKSHGCVNLTPRDAARLYELTGPTVPVGWTAVFPTKRNPASLIRVR